MNPPSSKSIPRAPKRSASTSSSSTTGDHTGGHASSSPSASKRSRVVHFATEDDETNIGPQLLPSRPTHDPTITDDGADNSDDDDRDLPMDPRWSAVQARARAQAEASEENEEEEDEEEDDPELHVLGGARRGTHKRDRFEGDRSGDEDSEEEEQDEDDGMFGDGRKYKSKTKGNKKRTIQPMSKEDRKAQFFGKVGQFMDADDDNGGIELEPFNMRDEMREGGFDESGTFIRKQDANARYDNWLAGLTEADMESAAMAQEAREQERQVHEQAVASRVAQFGSKPHQLTMALCGLLLPRETPTACLGRLNGRIERGPPKKRKAGSKKSGQAEHGAAEWKEPLASQWARQDVALVTDLADHLLNVCGMSDIYETDREELVADLRDDGHVPRQWAPMHPLAAERKVSWAYSWMPAGTEVEAESVHGAETHGPFEASDMKGWADQGFFANGILAQRFVNGVPVGAKVVVSGDDVSDWKWEVPS